VEPEPLTPELAVTLSGYILSHAKVTKVESSDGVGFCLIDTNGDQREVEKCFYTWNDEDWDEELEGGWGPSGGWGFAYRYALARRP
jgi:hypothetical protein